jgi:hypothetical protein
MPPKELTELADDIGAQGLRDPITQTPDGFILDGRNRAKACAMAGIEPTFTIFPGDPWLYSLSKNKHRRHMSSDQIALVAAMLATRGEGGDGSNQHIRATASNEVVARRGMSNAEAAKASGVPKSSIESAKALLKDGTAEEIEAVKTGRAKLRKTADKMRMRKATPKAPEDPIGVIAAQLGKNCSDGRWHTLDKAARLIPCAASALKEALVRLGDTRRHSVTSRRRSRARSGFVSRIGQTGRRTGSRQSG